MTSDGRPPANLTVTENGRPAADLTLTSTTHQAAIALAIDTSQSMNGAPLANAVAAARKFVFEQSSDTTLAVYGFDSKAYSSAPFPASQITAANALSSLFTGAQAGHRDLLVRGRGLPRPRPAAVDQACAGAADGRLVERREDDHRAGDRAARPPTSRSTRFDDLHRSRHRPASPAHLGHRRPADRRQRQHRPVAPRTTTSRSRSARPTPSSTRARRRTASRSTSGWVTAGRRRRRPRSRLRRARRRRATAARACCPRRPAGRAAIAGVAALLVLWPH